MNTEAPALQLPEFDKRLAEEYFKQGLTSGGVAYQKLRPHVQYNTARTHASNILKKPEVQEYISTLSAPAKEEIPSIKKQFVQKVNRITEKAENAAQYSAALKGCELEARVEGLFSQEEGDTAQYMQFFDKVSIVVNPVLSQGQALPTAMAMAKPEPGGRIIEHGRLGNCDSQEAEDRGKEEQGSQGQEAGAQSGHGEVCEAGDTDGGEQGEEYSKGAGAEEGGG